MWKRYANYEGGTADPLIVSWPDADRAGRRGPATSTPTPSTSSRRSSSAWASSCPTSSTATRRTDRGGELRDTFDDADAPTRKKTQFYSMLGTRAVWHKGWKAATAVPAAPESWGDFHQQRWELFDTESDPSECHDLAGSIQRSCRSSSPSGGRRPASTRRCRSNRGTRSRSSATERPELSKPRSRYVYYPGGAEVPESVAPEHPQPLVHDRGRGGRRDAGGQRRPLLAGIRASAATRSTSRTAQLKYVYNWIGQLVQVIESNGDRSRPVMSSSRPTSRRPGQRLPTKGQLSLHIRDQQVGEERS